MIKWMLLGLLALVGGTRPAWAATRVMVIAPHPDDEALMAAGVIRQAVERSDDVTVVVVTNGDLYRPVDAQARGRGLQRQAETVAAMAALGLAEDRVVFLGYGDDSLMGHYRSVDPDVIRRSGAGMDLTYGERGLGRTDFRTYLSGRPGAYSRGQIAADFRALLTRFRPDEIYTTSRYDAHPDHQATLLFLTQALLRLRQEGWGRYAPRLHEAIVHAPNWSRWPALRPAPDERVQEPEFLGLTSLIWRARERFLVPASMVRPDPAANVKAQALAAYRSQASPWSAAFVRRDEVFWAVDYQALGTKPGNVAYLAQLAASSEHAGARQGAASAVDGISAGCPRFCEHEWVADTDQGRAWLRLHWDRPVVSGEIALFPRQPAAAGRTSAVLTFGDGSQAFIKDLDAGGRVLRLAFPRRAFASLEVALDAPGSRSTGLAEIEVYGHFAAAPP